MSPSYETIRQAIDAAARTDSAAIALLAPDGATITYGELAGTLLGVAARLRDLGARGPQRVALVAHNGLELALLALGVSASAICVPLDPRTPEHELVARLNELQPALIVAHADLAAAHAAARRAGVPWIDAKALLAISASDAAVRASASGLAPPAGDAVAFILHTSGTTARPKRVPLTHRNVCRSALNVAAALQLTTSDRCLNVMPLFHVHGLVGALLASMCTGGSVACSRGFEVGRFAEWLETLAPTWYTAVPTVHQAVLAELRHEEPARRHGLRLVRSSSAALAPALATALEQRLGVPVIEAYGMTEAAHQIASHRFATAYRARGSVGCAAGPAVAVLDTEGKVRDRGTGEIVIRGDNVMRGYDGDADANAAAFHDGWFRTGDQGTVDAQGYLWITARIKEIVKRGGEGVAPREVEEALLEDPAVHECAAFAVPHPTLGEDLAAAVVLVPGSNATGQSLRAALFGRLSESHIPSRVVVVDSLERSASGKVQRSELWKKLAATLEPDHVAPRTATERRIATIFAEVLEVDSVGANDNFFALGGDSLRGTQALSRIHAQCGVELMPAELFRFPTASELARIVDTRDGVVATT
ncbi:MAG TPA: non-ribosomal peptide synthetase [Casimicrobiaceae bacterium]|nr:non-ribosomal peptide synthetase [Casimicrobiaceae bacterium]